VPRSARPHDTLRKNMPAMTELEVIQVIREHLEGQFPKVCSACKRSFPSFREFLLTTTAVGSTMSYDAEFNDWKPAQPLAKPGFSRPILPAGCGARNDSTYGLQRRFPF